jgi:hypothetical protein
MGRQLREKIGIPTFRPDIIELNQYLMNQNRNLREGNTLNSIEGNRGQNKY